MDYEPGYKINGDLYSPPEGQSAYPSQIHARQGEPQRKWDPNQNHFQYCQVKLKTNGAQVGDHRNQPNCHFPTAKFKSGSYHDNETAEHSEIESQLEPVSLEQQQLVIGISRQYNQPKSFEYAVERVDDCFQQDGGEVCSNFERESLHHRNPYEGEQAAHSQRDRGAAPNSQQAVAVSSPNSTVHQCNLAREPSTAQISERNKYTEVFSWGEDKHGQLGLGERFANGEHVYRVPKRCTYAIEIAQISCGRSHSVFFTPSNLVYAMGSNYLGELGINDDEVKIKFSPILIDALVGATPIEVSCGDNHSMVLCLGEAGGPNVVYAWGHNQSGQTGVGRSHARRRNLVLAPEPIDWGDTQKPNIVQISCGGSHSAMVDQNGRLYQCGDNRSGQLGLGHFDSAFSPKRVLDVTDIVTEVSCGPMHTAAVSRRGKVWVMGSNATGQLGIGQQYDDQCVPLCLKELNFAHICRVRAGAFNAALSSENQLYMWGQSKFGDFFTPHRVKFFENHSIRDFQVSSAGSVFVLTNQGDLYSWGDNKYSQLGLNDFKTRSKPERVASLDCNQIVSIATGHSFTIALGQTFDPDYPNQTAVTETGSAHQNHSVVLQREDSTSALISIDTHPNKLREQQLLHDSQQQSKKAKAKSKSKDRRQAEENPRSPPADSVLHQLSFQSRGQAASRGSNKLEKQKSYSNLQTGLKTLAKQAKKKSKSVPKTSCVPAASTAHRANVAPRMKNPAPVSGIETAPSRHEESESLYVRPRVPSSNQNECYPTMPDRTCGRNNNRLSSRQHKHEDSMMPESDYYSRKSAMNDTKPSLKYEPLLQNPQGPTSKLSTLKIDKRQSVQTKPKEELCCEIVINDQLINRRESRHLPPSQELTAFKEQHHMAPTQQAPDTTTTKFNCDDARFQALNDPGSRKQTRKSSAVVSPNLPSNRQQISKHHNSQVNSLGTTAHLNRNDEEKEFANIQSDEKPLSQYENVLTSPDQEERTQTDLRELNLFDQHFRQSETHNSQQRLDTQSEEIRRLNELVKDLHSEIDQHKQDKEGLRIKIKSMEEICVDVTGKKNKALAELEVAAKEVKQFRDDVAYLTKETSQLLDDLQAEQERREKAESQLKKAETEFDKYRKNNSVRIEDIQRQLELSHFNASKLQEEIQQWKSLADDLKTEKQEMSKRLSSEREEYRAAFRELEQLKSTQAGRLEQSHKEILNLRDQLQQHELEAKHARDSIDRLRAINKEQAESIKGLQQAQREIQMAKDQQNAVVSALRKDNDEKEQRIKTLYEENMSLQRRIDADIIHRASQYAQAQMHVLSSVSSHKASNIYKRNSSKKEMRPMSFSEMEDNLQVQPYQNREYAANDRDKFRTAQVAPEVTMPRQLRQECKTDSVKYDVRRYSVSRSPPRGTDVSKDRRQDDAYAMMKESEERIRAIFGTYDRDTSFDRMKSGISCINDDSNILSKRQALQVHNESMDSFNDFSQPSIEVDNRQNRQVFSSQQPVGKSYTQAFPMSITDQQSYPKLPFTPTLSSCKNRNDEQETRHNESAQKSFRHKSHEPASDISARINQPETKRSLRSTSRTPDLETLLKQRYEREKHKSRQNERIHGEDDHKVDSSNFMGVVTFSKPTNLIRSALDNIQQRTSHVQSRERTLDDAQLRHKLGSESSDHAIKASLADLKMRLTNMRQERTKTPEIPSFSEAHRYKLKNDDSLTNSTQGLIAMLRQ